MLSLGVLSLVTFFAQAKKVIKKHFPARNSCAARCQKTMEFKFAYNLPPTTRAAFLLYVHFFAPRKETNQRNEPREGIPSGSLLGRLLPLRGGGIGIMVALFRYHLVCIRRASVRSALARLCRVRRSPLGLAVRLAEGDRGKRVGRTPIFPKNSPYIYTAVTFPSFKVFTNKINYDIIL